MKISRRAALLCGAVLLLPPGAARADEPATLTQALVAAYYNNTTLQEQRAQLRATDENVPAALSGWRPQVEFTGSYGSFSSTQTQTGFETPSLQNGFRSTIPASNATSETRNNSVGQLSLTQPLYTGGKVLSDVRKAKNSVYAARAQLLAEEQTVFMNVVQAYVSVITDAQVLALDRNNESVLQQQLRATQDQFNVGEITMTSLAQAQASLAQGKEQVEVAYGNLQIARENFRELVGEYPAEHPAPPQPLSLPVDNEAAAAGLAIANNPNVIAAQFTDAANKDAIDVAYSALMPQVSVQLLGFKQNNPTVAHSHLTGGEVLGQLTVPIYQGGSEYAAIRQARATEQQSFAAILDAKRTAYATATQSWIALVSSRAAIVSTNAEIKANAIALDGTEREELVGTLTTLDVLNAQQLLVQSQVQQVQNIATMVTNSYTVAEAIGRLTATDLGLPVQQYDDLKYYRSVKYAGFGTGEAADKKAGIAPDGTLLFPGPPPDLADEPPGPPAD